MLDRVRAYEFKLQKFFSLIQTKNSPEALAIQKQLAYLEEDLAFTEESFVAKDAIKSRMIQAATKRYADKYYRVRQHELLERIYQILAAELPRTDENLTKIVKLKLRLQEGVTYSFSYQEAFHNPYPSSLLFSQPSHSPNFSGGLARKGVSGQSVVSVAARLRADALDPEFLDPDFLRVAIYLAPYRGVLQPFVYNNRTWTAFSLAEVPGSRIVPVVPTRDLLKRIERLSELGHDGKTIICEDDSQMSTKSQLPGFSSL